MGSWPITPIKMIIQNILHAPLLLLGGKVQLKVFWMLVIWMKVFLFLASAIRTVKFEWEHFSTRESLAYNLVSIYLVRRAEQQDFGGIHWLVTSRWTICGASVFLALSIPLINILWTPSKDLPLPPLLSTPREEESQPVHETGASLTQRSHASHSLWGPGFGIGVSLSTRWIPSLQIWPFLLFEYCIPFVINNAPFKTATSLLSEICSFHRGQGWINMNHKCIKVCMLNSSWRLLWMQVPGWTGTYRYCLWGMGVGNGCNWLYIQCLERFNVQQATYSYLAVVRSD